MKPATMMYNAFMEYLLFGESRSTMFKRSNRRKTKAIKMAQRPHQGPKERARRRKQMENGKLVFHNWGSTTAQNCQALI